MTGEYQDPGLEAAPVRYGAGQIRQGPRRNYLFNTAVRARRVQDGFAVPA